MSYPALNWTYIRIPWKPDNAPDTLLCQAKRKCKKNIVASTEHEEGWTGLDCDLRRTHWNFPTQIFCCFRVWWCSSRKSRMWKIVGKMKIPGRYMEGSMHRMHFIAKIFSKFISTFFFYTIYKQRIRFSLLLDHPSILAPYLSNELFESRFIQQTLMTNIGM